MTSIGNPRTLSYLATPYTKFPGGIVSAFIASCELAARLIQAGVRVYSPIAHCHAIATHSDLDPLNHRMWMALDEVMLSAADILIVAHMPTWECSVGMAMEIEFFEKAGKPIFDLDPESLVMKRRAKPAKPLDLSEMTLDQLRAEHAQWDAKIQAATSWGAAVGVAGEFRDEAAAWIRRREQEQSVKL